MNQDQQLRQALERAQQDINWMLNEQKFLNVDVFDYIDSALTATQQAAHSQVPKARWCDHCGEGVALFCRGENSAKCQLNLPQQAAPSQGAGEILDDAFDALMTQSASRYHVDEMAHGFWPNCVRAGDGTLELFIGRQKQCTVVARRLAGAFGDGVFAMKQKAAAILEASAQREQPAQAMQRWQIMPTVKVRSTNQELSVTGVYEDVVFVDLPEQPAASKPECPLNCYEACVAQTHGCASECPAPSNFTLRPQMPEPQARAGECTCGACGKSGCVAGECNDLASLRKPTEQSLSDQLNGAVDCLEAGIFWDDGSIEKLLRLAIEAIAKKDAALKACVESAAKAIYSQWKDRVGYVPWVDGGNSIMQDDARAIARAAITQGQEASK